MPDPKVEKGRWYYGFICPDCKTKIIIDEDPSEGKELLELESGIKLICPCPGCSVDEKSFNLTDLISFQADEDELLPSRIRPSNRPRQPISSRYSRAKPRFFKESVEEQPTCAVIMARCVVLWSRIEAELAFLLAGLLKINSEPAAAMFLAIQNSRTQQDVLIAVAEIVLTASDLELLHAIMSSVRSVEKERNDLVHGIYGGSLLVENGLLWIAKKDYVKHHVALRASRFRNISENEIQKLTFVYEAEDLETIAQKLEQLYNLIVSFQGYLRQRKGRSRSELYRQLCAELHIREERSPNSERQKNNPKSHPRSNQKGRKQK
jgi:hypothetical protein